MHISTTDVVQHIVKVGLDVYQPINIPENRTRLNIFFEEARAQHGDLFDCLVSSDAEFNISCRFTTPGGPKLEFKTFVMTERGPVFAIPLTLPGINDLPFGSTFLTKLESVQEIFFGAFPDRKIMKFGVVRQIILETGKQSCVGVLKAPSEFAGAKITGGRLDVRYVDDLCNVSLTFEPLRASKVTRLTVGAQFNEELGHALGLKIDVNHKEVRPLEAADIQGVIERAEQLWPDVTLELLKEWDKS